MGSWHQALEAVPVLRAIQARIFPMKEVPVVVGKAGDLASGGSLAQFWGKAVPW